MQFFRAIKSLCLIGICLICLGNTQSALSAGNNGALHPNDPIKNKEHLALMALVPAGAVTHRAIQSGSWSSASTWQSGQVPSTGSNVQIPNNIQVEYDVISDNRIRTVRIDGILKFSSNRSTRITVDTIVVTPDGALRVADAGNPVKPNHRVEFVFRSNGPIDLSWDPTLLSRGLISHGEAKIFGAEKKAFYKLAQNPGAGTSTISLNAAPVGWRVGDKVAITATDYKPAQWQGKNLIFQPPKHDVGFIKTINGQSITLQTPLKHSHIPAQSSMPVYAANLTRNVEFKTDKGSAVPISQRAHVMFMHSNNLVVRGAGFYSLGRTNKATPLSLSAANSNSNMNGRYSVHVHRSGVGPDSSPSIIYGSAVEDSPGWGFVNHDSYVDMTNNASLNVLGTHYVTERGSEHGSFRDNIAMVSKGDGTRHHKAGLGGNTQTGDLAHAGHGFWMQSRNVALEGNVVSNTAHAAIMYFHRSNEKESVPVTTRHLITPHKDIAAGSADISFNSTPVVVSRNNTVLNAAVGLHVVKARWVQGHDVRNVFENYTGYNLRQGANLEYTAKYTLKNFKLYADDDSQSQSALNLGSNTQDVALQNIQIHNFSGGVSVSSGFNCTGGRIDADLPDVALVDMTYNNVKKEFGWHDQCTNVRKTTYDPKYHLRTSASSFDANRLKFEIDPGQNLSLTNKKQYLNNGAEYFGVKGTRYDQAGPGIYRNFWQINDIQSHFAAAGHYKSGNSNKIILLTLLVDRFDASKYKHICFDVDATGHQAARQGPLRASRDEVLKAVIARHPGGAPLNLVEGCRAGGGPNPNGDTDANRPPVARLTASKTSGTAPLEVSFDASTTTDPDGNSLQYTWNYGNGDIKLGSKIQLSFTNTGQHTVRVTVADEFGATDSAAVTVQVNKQPGDLANKAPIPSMSAIPGHGNNPLAVSFSGANSIDPDGDPITFQWTFGNGQVVNGKDFVFSFGQSGTHAVTLTVKDNKGGSTSKTIGVTVSNTHNNAACAGAPNVVYINGLTYRCKSKLVGLDDE